LQTASQPGYRADIDGLRAIAVLAVVGFHAEIGALRGGFIGVDIFFVISGYLISGIILKSLQRDRFSFIEFYVRRINRIFPALVLVLSCVVALGWVVLFPPEFSTLGTHILGGAGFLSNFVLWSDTGYFASQNKPLLHLWSLAVEEQFYLFWPVILFAAYKARWNAIQVIATCVALSFAVNLWLVGHSEATAAFYLPFGRFWEILVGGFLVVAENSRINGNRIARATRARDAFSVLGLFLLTASILTVDQNTLWPGWPALLPVVGTLLLIWSGPGAAINRYLLGRRSLVWIGLISYPLYLWHWPLFVFARVVNEGQVPRTVRIGIVVASFVLAALTYVLVERPIRFGARKRRSAARLAVAMAAVAMIGLSMKTAVAQPRLGRKYNTVVAFDKKEAPPGGYFDKKDNAVGIVLPGKSTRKIVFLGDSHAVQYRPRLEKLAERNSDFPTVIFFTYGGCPPYRGVNRKGIAWDGVTFRCDKFEEMAFARAKQPDVETVVFSAYWEDYFEQSDNQHPLFRIEDSRRNPTLFPGNGSDSILEAFEHELAAMTRAGKRVFLILPNPDAPGLNPAALLPRRLPWLSPGKAQQKVALTDAVARSARLRDRLNELAKRAGATVIDPVPFLCRCASCQTIGPDGRSMYVDDHHLRPSFVREYAKYIDQIVTHASR
jgi:peptidoglycan/LPS O-acetylase OafA/YrhL